MDSDTEVDRDDEVMASKTDAREDNYNDPLILQSIWDKQIFCCWLEEWEKPLLEKNDFVSMTKLLQKYKSIVWYDPDDNITYTACEERLRFLKPKKSNGWGVLGISENWDGVSEN